MKEIKLNRGYNVLIDDEDYDNLMQFKWYIRSNKQKKIFYAGTSIDGHGVLMHNYILGCKPIDHIDGNGLNNQRYNLRPCNLSQNSANRKKREIGSYTSKYKGVSFQVSRNKWRCCIGKDYKYYFIGRFDTEKEAALAYNQRAIELFGKFALLNEVLPDEI